MGKSVKYQLGRKSGRKKTSSLRQFSISTPVEDGKLIRELVGENSLSGFGWRACMILAYLLYGDRRAAGRAESVLREILTDEQLTSVSNRLRDLADVL